MSTFTLATPHGAALLLGAVAVSLASAPTPAAAAGFGLMHEVSVLVDAQNKPLKAPEGVTCAGEGRFFVADTGNGRILEYSVAGRKISGGREIKNATITTPTRIVLAKSGEMLVLDGRARHIYKLDAGGGLIGPISFTDTPSKKELDVGAFALDADGNIVAYDVASGAIVIASPFGVFQRELALPPGRRAITDVHVDAQGTLWVIDALSSTVFAAERGAKTLTPRSKSLKREVEFPVHLTTTAERVPVLVDANGSRLVLLTPEGTVMGNLLSIGQRDGFLYYPSQICINGQGQLLVADRGNHRIQVFRTTR